MRNKEDGLGLVQRYRQSGLTRRQFCEKHHVRISTLDYWRYAQKKQPKLLEVAIEPPSAGVGFVLVLGNGRRIESSWRFAPADLVRLIRAAEE